MKGIFSKFNKTEEDGPHPRKEPRYEMKISVENLKTVFEDCDDFATREIILGNSGLTATIAYIDGIVSGDAVSKDIINPLTNQLRLSGEMTEQQVIDKMVRGAVYSYAEKVRDTMDDLANDIVNGFCAVIFDNSAMAVTFEVKSGERRQVSESTSEKVLKGAKDAFVETLRVNTNLIRKKIKNPDLKVKQTTVGRQTLTSAAIVYIDGLTNKDFVNEVEKRLDGIDVDEIITTANFEGFLSDNRRSPLPQLLYTERADKFCLNIMEGRVGIIIDGLPMCYLAPGTFGQFIKAPEDSSEHFAVSSLLTIIRYICLIITIFLPAFYVAITMYHQEMIPTQLMLSVIESKKNVPFTTPVEVLGMLVAFELLQEASIRLPNPVGDTLGLIGALIMGQSAVEAKVISPLVVIVVGIAGISGYTISNLDMSSCARLGRMALVILALLFGMYGIAVGAVIIVYHLSSLTSLGVPYMTPFAGADYGSLAKAVFSFPPDRLKFREKALVTDNKRKQK